MKKRYLFRVMRLLILFLLVGFMHVTAAINAQTVTLEGKGLSFKKVLQAIKVQSGYEISGSSDVIALGQPITVSARQMPLKEFLNVILADQQIDFEMDEKTIVLLKKDKGSGVGDPEALANVVVQQNIRGRIFDPVGKPLPGATVSVAGNRSKTTATDDHGYFVLSDLADNTTLVVTAVGYLPLNLSLTQTVVVMQRTQAGEESGTHLQGAPANFSVRMRPDVVDMEEVVITGLYTRTAESFTGSATTVTGDELRKISTSSVFAAVAAMEPAFRIVADNVAGGNINQLPEIQMRGSNSFPNLSGQLSANPNQPLFILDGFEVSLQRIVDLDLNLIASITLLKDASATAIYGSRGANGVMVVSTVTPRPGQLQVTFNNDFRFTTPDLSDYNLDLTSFEKLDFERRAGVYTADGNPNNQHALDLRYNQRYRDAASGIDVDWLPIPLQNGFNNRSSLYLQGGDQTIRYGFQATADLQSGVMKGQTRDNYSGQFDLNYVVKKWQFQNSIRIFQNVANESPYGNFSEYVRMNPYWSPYDADGNLNTAGYPLTTVFGGVNSTRLVGNPVADAALHSVNKNQYFGLSNNFSMRYNVLRGLYLESSFSLNKQSGSSDQFYSAEDSRFLSITDISRKGSYTARTESSFNYESLTSANYNITGGKHQFFSSLVFNFASNTNAFYSVMAEGFPFDRLDNLLFATQYELNGRPTGDENTTRRVGVLYSGNYSFDNRFLADLSVRRDGSSQYGSSRKFGTFWSAGLGWNIHNESFFRQSDVINRLRLRSSYGTTGSLNIPAYGAQTRYNFGVNTTYYGRLGAAMSALGNPNLAWQNVSKLNVGVDATLWRERIDLRAEVYRELNSGAVTQISLPISSGFSNYFENLGEIENTGFEFNARVKLLENNTEGILWSVNVGGITNKQILKKLSNKLQASNDRLEEANSGQTAPNIQFREGESMRTIYVVRSLGIDPATGNEVFLDRNGNKTFTWDALDKVPFGIAEPKWNGNFGTNLIYKGLEVNVLFSYQTGGQLYNQTLLDRVENLDPAYNADSRAYTEGWQGPGHHSKFRTLQNRIDAGANNTSTRLTSRFVQDDNTLNMTSASIGYNFYRSTFVRRIGLRSLQITAITNDIFRVSTIELERGLNNPFARTYSLSLRAGF